MGPVDLKSAGVYRIRCILNGKEYYGQAASFEKRFRQHRDQLAKGTHHSKALQADWQHYGEPAFTFEPLKIVGDNEQRNETEQRMIEGFADKSRLYNSMLRFPGAEVSRRENRKPSNKFTVYLNDESLLRLNRICVRVGKSRSLIVQDALSLRMGATN